MCRSRIRKRFTPDWTFGIREQELQKLVDDLRNAQHADVVVLLSHNGMDVDLKLASRCTGIDIILGGHTHDAVPRPVIVANPCGKTLVTNAGSNGKFLGVLDLDVGKGALKNVRYTLLPVFADLIKPDGAMAALIERLRAPYAAQFSEKLASCDQLLYRRGNFIGPMDQVICDALRQQLGAQIALSPGFRWGTTMLANQSITREDVLAETAISYPETYVQDMTGSALKAIMEDVADNLFNPDPYLQQGGDMVRVGGMDYACAPNEAAGKRISDMALNDGTPSKRTRPTASPAGPRSIRKRRAGLGVVEKYLGPTNADDQARQPRHAQGRGQQSRHHRWRLEMSSIVRSILLAAVVAFLAAGGAQAEAGKPHRVVIQVDQNDAEVMNSRSTTPRTCSRRIAPRTRTRSSRSSPTAPACTCCATTPRR